MLTKSIVDANYRYIAASQEINTPSTASVGIGALCDIKLLVCLRH